MPLADLIRDARVSQGLTRSGLCAAANISRIILYRVERGELLPSAAVCDRLAEALKLDVDAVCSAANHLAPDLLAAAIANPHTVRDALDTLDDWPAEPRSRNRGKSKTRPPNLLDKRHHDDV